MINSSLSIPTCVAQSSNAHLTTDERFGSPPPHRSHRRCKHSSSSDAHEASASARFDSSQGHCGALIRQAAPPSRSSYAASSAPASSITLEPVGLRTGSVTLHPFLRIRPWSSYIHRPLALAFSQFLCCQHDRPLRIPQGRQSSLSYARCAASAPVRHGSCET
jgi:hypothetical protein